MAGFDGNVVFINERGVRVTRHFESPYLCRRFVNKLAHSKTCKLVSHPFIGGN